MGGKEGREGGAGGKTVLRKARDQTAREREDKTMMLGSS